MTDIVCDWCGKHFNKTPAKIKNDKHHFHTNDCRLKYQKAFGCQMRKPDHSLYKKLVLAGIEHRKNHPKSQWDALNKRI